MLDWERFQRIFQPNQEEKKQLSSLNAILDESEFLIDFLRHLSRELKQFGSSSECVKTFPHGRSCLTKASDHPFIGCNKAIVQLLMDCLMEYSKFSQDLKTPTSAANEHKDNIEKNSTKWCIIRLRRLMSCKIPQKEDSGTQYIQKQIKSISEILDTKGNTISNECITALTGACLGLLDQSREAHSLIEKLVTLAIPFKDDNLHFDKQSPCLSKQFLYHLTHESSHLNRLYRSWPSKLKASLWLHYNDILEMELLDLIEEHTQESHYITTQTLCHRIQEYPLITIANTYPAIQRKINFNLADLIISLCDYRLIKLNRCIDSNLLDIRTKPPKEVYHGLQNYIYDASIEEIEKRRNVAWCFALGLYDVLVHAVLQVVEWCRGSDIWTNEMEDTIVYINWLICPSLDHREHKSLSYLKHWFQSKQDENDHSRLYHSLNLDWRLVFRENKIVVACFIAVILGLSVTQLTVDQKLSLMNNVMMKESTDKNVIDLGIAYCILDFLHEIKDNKTLSIHNKNNDIDELIDYVNKHI